MFQQTHSYAITPGTTPMGVVTKDFLRGNSQCFHSGMAVGMLFTSDTYF